MTDTELATIRAHIGSACPPTDAELAAAYERLGSASAVALEVLTARHTEMILNTSLDFTAVGDFHDKRDANIAALERKLKALDGVVAGGADAMSFHRIVRPGRSR